MLTISQSMTCKDCLDNQSSALLLRDNVGSPWGICDQQAAEAYCMTAGQHSVRTKDCRITVRPHASLGMLFAKTYWVVDDGQCSRACGHVAIFNASSMFCKSITSDCAVKTSYICSTASTLSSLHWLLLDASFQTLCGWARRPENSTAACDLRAISKVSAKCTGAQRCMASQYVAAKKSNAQRQSAFRARA